MTIVLETVDTKPNNLTTAEIGVGDYFLGTLTSTDIDWIAVQLVAGTTYSALLTGLDTPSSGIENSYLRLYSASGAILLEDDNSGPGQSSLLDQFTVSMSGTYYLQASTYAGLFGAGQDEGTYGLSIALGDKATANYQMAANILLRDNHSWASSSNSPVTISWGIRTSTTAGTSGNYLTPNGDNFETLSANQIQTATYVINYISGLTGLSFTQNTAAPDTATVLLGAYTSTTDGYGAYAYYPGTTENAGDLWINNYWINQNQISIGSYSYYVFLHQMGHVVGLSHPSDYTANSSGQITFDLSAQFAEDSQQYTVMSYFDAENTTATVGSTYPDTFLLYDIYALQQLYGANYTTNDGNTVYGFNSSLKGTPFDFDTNTIPFLCIWDGGGLDTIDVSSTSSNQRISLIEGEFSDVLGYKSNLSIAFGTVIETAIGGSGNDALIGNSAANLLIGGIGNDTIDGGAGNDTLYGGDGNDLFQDTDGADTMYGGQGNDTYYIDRIGDQITEFAAEGIDTVYTSINLALWTLNPYLENLVLTGTGNQTIQGNQLDNTLIGNSGNNTLNGGWGNDTLIGNGGNDVFQDAFGADAMYGGAGNDKYYIDNILDQIFENPSSGVDSVSSSISFSLRDHSQYLENLTLTGANNIYAIGNANANTIYGNSGDNLINGAWGNDTLFGGAGNDTFQDDKGIETMYGQKGNDTYYVDNPLDSIIEYANEGTDVVISTITIALRDLSQHLEILKLEGSQNIDGIGNGYNNIIYGNSNSNTLNGAWGNDTLFGGDGNDMLRDDKGDDILYGGRGDDLFYVDSSGDLIREFVDEGVDTVISNVSFALRDHSQNLENLTLSGPENLNGTGNGLANTIIGNSGNNLINGAWGNDVLVGGAGNDKFDDDRGSDTMTGGEGADIFVFRNDFGEDQITDFDPYEFGEHIDFSYLDTISNYKDLLENHLTESQGNIIISDETGNTLILINISAAALTVDDFKF